MTADEMKRRTKAFAVQVIQFARQLPDERVGWTFLGQIVRSSSSVGANYRAVCRAKSDKDFISKMETTTEEADETLFWLEMIEEVYPDLLPAEVKRLQIECNELVSIFTASIKTVKGRQH